MAAHPAYRLVELSVSKGEAELLVRDARAHRTMAVRVDIGCHPEQDLLVGTAHDTGEKAIRELNEGARKT